jgi:hypothetical protein
MKGAILAVCRRLEWPYPIGPRRTVAPARCISRAFNTIASESDCCSKRSFSPKNMRSSMASLGICIAYSLEISLSAACCVFCDSRNCARHFMLVLDAVGEEMLRKIKCVRDQRGHDRAADYGRDESRILSLVDDAMR